MPLKKKKKVTNQREGDAFCPDWNESIVDNILKRLEPRQSSELEVLVLEEAKKVTREIYSGQSSSFQKENVHLVTRYLENVPLFKTWEQMSHQQLIALVRCCAMSVHHIGGCRIGNRWIQNKPFWPYDNNDPEDLITIPIRLKIG